MDTYAYRYIDVVTCRDVKIFAENGIEFAREQRSETLLSKSGPVTVSDFLIACTQSPGQNHGLLHNIL